MNTSLELPLTSSGRVLDASESTFGELRRSNEIAEDAEALRTRMNEDGYLFLPGLLNRKEVLEARRVVTERLAAEGLLDPAYPSFEAVAQQNSQAKLRPDLTDNNEPLHRVLYSGAMMDFFARFLGGPVLHFDFTWFRAIAPGPGTLPHCDVVYMGRGTKNLYTAWTPVGDVPLEVGGLMILEHSHRKANKLSNYLERDVDEYCTNGRDAAAIASGKKLWPWAGFLSKNPVTLREKLGGRWLTTEFRAGDVLIFTMATVHASLDNQSRHIRFSSDSRYQLASEPADERWIGAHPVGHGLAGKRGRIC